MNGYKGLTTIICVAAVGLGLAACGGGSGTSGMRNPVDPGIAESIERATALNVAIEAAKATVADGTFDDAAHMVAPTVAATHDGTAVTVGVTEGGMRQSGNAGGSFAEREDGPAPIAGWTGARFERGTAIERLTVYTDVGAPEAMAFTPDNLNRLNEVSGLAGERDTGGRARRRSGVLATREVDLSRGGARARFRDTWGDGDGCRRGPVVQRRLRGRGRRLQLHRRGLLRHARRRRARPPRWPGTGLSSPTEARWCRFRTTTICNSGGGCRRRGTAPGASRPSRAVRASPPVRAP